MLLGKNGERHKYLKVVETGQDLGPPPIVISGRGNAFHATVFVDGDGL
jgi:hypothetical protein